MSELEVAHARFLHAITKAVPPSISINAHSSEFEDLREYIAKQFAPAVDDFLSALASDARSNGANIITSDFHTLFQDAIDGAGLLSDLTDEAESIKDHEAEVRADPRGWAKAQAMGVD